MRIAVTTGTFHPDSGGPPTYLHRLGRELGERGHALRLLTFGERSPEVYPYPVTRVSRRLPLAPRLSLYTLHAARVCAWADVVFASDYGLPATLLRLVIRRPVVLKVVGDFAWESAVRRRLIPPSTSIDAFQNAPKGPAGAGLAAIQRFYATRADRVIVPSAYLAGLVRGWGVDPDRVRVIHNAVDVEAFDRSPSPDDARRALGLDGPVLLTIARLTAWKGVDHAIRVVAALGASHNLQMVHCGEGPEESRLKALAAELGVADRVQFHGRVPRARVPLYLSAADIFVLYSGYEGLPHVVLEAMAARVPVIVSDRGGNVEVVEHGQTGIVVPWDRPAHLTSAVANVLSDPSLRDALAGRARAAVESRFGWSRLVEQTTRVFEEARASA